MSELVSIIVCTRNRADPLRDTLASISRCEIPSDLRTELLVVDNGSTDQTRQAVAGISARYIREDQTGQSHARNRGLAESNGRVILFTDDDVRVPRGWVEGMSRPILDERADAVAGGLIFPPELDRKMKICRSWFASTENIIPSRPDRCVGANMAFDREILQQVPAFDPELGPGALGFGDETLFCFQLRQAGFRLISQFDVAVEHHFDPRRLSRQGMLEMADRMGRSRAYIAYHWRHADLHWNKIQILRETITSWLNRARHFHRSATDQQPALWELKAVESAAFREQYLHETRRPYNYDIQGLTKVAGGPAGAAAMVR